MSAVHLIQILINKEASLPTPQQEVGGSGPSSLLMLFSVSQVPGSFHLS